MIALLMVFDLSTSHLKVDDLRSGLPASMERYRQMDGLRQKVYLSDGAETFGAFYLFETQEDLDAALPKLRASSTQHRTGVIPQMVQFGVEAIVEGQHSTPDLSQAGRGVSNTPCTDCQSGIGCP
jgi:hypothetical protein